ncbi:MAG: response regulator [Chloroflexi bacterium]|nr:response regulator [Chloroflexota bacterium]
MGKKVLYIEDNADNVLLVQRALESRGYEFEWALNGLSGLEKAEANPPDVIMLDINLPDLDGYEVARRLRAHATLRAIPIIAITANALKGDADKALAAGCDLYMPKPINLRELWTQLAALLPS